MLRATLESKRAVQGGVYIEFRSKRGGGGCTPCTPPGSSPGLALGIMYESLVLLKLILEFLNIFVLDGGIV